MNNLKISVARPRAMSRAVRLRVVILALCAVLLDSGIAFAQLGGYELDSYGCDRFWGAWDRLAAADAGARLLELTATVGVTYLCCRMCRRPWQGPAAAARTLTRDRTYHVAMAGTTENFRNGRYTIPWMAPEAQRHATGGGRGA